MRALGLSLDIFKGLLAGALLLCFVILPAPALADAAELPAADEKTVEAQDLRKWFEALPAEKREALQRRNRLLRALPREKQEAILKALNEGRDVFTPEQKEKLEKLSKLNFLQRARLHGLRTDLEQIGKRQPEFLRNLEKLPRQERAAALGRKLSQLRANRFVNGLDEKTRKELEALPEGERQRRGRELFSRASRARLEQLGKGMPQLDELRAKAEAGDKEARRKLSQLLRDLGALDQLIERLDEARRAEVRTRISGMNLDDATAFVRDELSRRRPEGPRRPRDGREGRDNGDQPPRNRPPREDGRERRR